MCSIGYPNPFFIYSFGLFMGEDFQKSELPTLLQFVMVTAAHQPHVDNSCLDKTLCMLQMDTFQDWR